MNVQRTYVRNGIGAVRPYVYGPASLLKLITEAFGGEVLGSSPDGGEVEVRIGDSVVALALGNQFPAGVATIASIYVYVADADAAYAAALAAGAVPISPPEDKPYDERQGTVQDGFGNVWHIATYTGDAPPATQPGAQIGPGSSR